MLKVKLPAAITSIPEAKDYLDMLTRSKLVYHPEDDVTTVQFSVKEKHQPTPEECAQMNKLMTDIYNVEGNNGNNRNPIFDPCEYLTNASKIFLMKDLTGRGHANRIDGNDLLQQFVEQADEDTSAEEKEDFESYISSAEVGDMWHNYRGTISLTRID